MARKGLKAPKPDKTSEAEKISKEISELRDRLESLESIIMVEQAGRLELKKALEELAVPAPPVEVEDLRERIRVLEVFKSEATDLVKSLDEKIGRVVEVPTKVVSDVELLKRSLDSTVKRVIATEKIPEKILEESKKNLAMINEKIDGVEKFITNLNKKIDTLESVSGENIKKFSELSDLLSKLSEERKRDIDETRKRIDELKKSVKFVPRLKNEVEEKIRTAEEIEREVRKRMEEIEAVDVTKIERKISGIESRIKEESRKEVVGMGGRISIVEKNITQLLGKVNMIVDLDKRVNSLEGISKENKGKISKLEDGLKVLPTLSREIELLKGNLSGITPQVSVLSKDIESLKGSLSENVAQIKNLDKSVKTFGEEIKKLAVSTKEIEEIRKNIEVVDKDLKENSNRLRFTEEEMKKIGSKVEGLEKVRVEMTTLSKEIESLRTSLSENVSLMKGIDSRIDGLEKVRLVEIGKSLEGVTKRLKAAEDEIKKTIAEVKKVKKVEPEEIKKVIDSIRAETGKSIDEVKTLMSSTISPLDSQLRSLSERIILLETRIGTLERLFAKKAAEPVVIE
ncbi:MAG: hypothetical protein QMD14_02935 [Candidatus Aenigmarchaeota archaeon]|nr:hypothetical protein [Candidatus Aenigmarchaeota archaeon]